jgi:acyl-coenzyme A synthetase/AMP-(fatty) acid ligase
MNFIDPILYLAKTRPNAPAIILPGAVVRYGQLASFSHSIATHLLRAGIGPGDAVVVATASPDIMILVRIALARVGAIAVANITDFGKSAAQHWASHLGVKAVCRTEADPAIDGVDSLVLAKDWLSVPAWLGPLPAAATEQDSTLRIAFSSGTTGAVKAIPLSHGATAHRVIGHQFGNPVCSNDRLLLLANLNMGPAFHVVFKHLYVGSPIVFGPAGTFSDFLATQDRSAVTQVFATAFTLARLLESVPAYSRVALSRATVTFSGAALPEPIWRKATRVFASPVLSNFGSTEGGPAAFGDIALLDQYPDAVGRKLPWVRLEAVDENDRPLSAGEQGVLRVRTPGMARGYHDDPAATAEVFRDGWFYPGDVGTVTLDGIVRVIGRNDDLLNFGGQKIAPSGLETVLAGAPNVRDVAAAALLDPNGVPSVGIAVVASGPIDQQSLAARCRGLVPPQLALHVVQLDAIPRNEMGKILRRELAARICAARSDVQAAR